VFDPDVLRLVAVTDSLHDGIDGLAGRAAAVVRGGATMVHLRLQNESPRTLVEVARALRAAVPDVPLLVNDRADVALAADADGVHVGSDGLTPAALRRVVPARFVIGSSLGVDDDVARVNGADYVGIGPVFVSGAGNEALGLARVTELCERSPLPVVAIGGITPDNVALVLAAGARGVAAISALFGATDPMQAARALRSAQDASER
jgi:thiamine-phosphate pyrophosphorylase